MSIENVFELFSNLSDSKFLHDSLTNDLRNILFNWQVKTECAVPPSLPQELNSNQRETEDNDDNDDNFYKEIDNLIAKAQQSIKLDYNNVNKKSKQFSSIISKSFKHRQLLIVTPWFK